MRSSDGPDVGVDDPPRHDHGRVRPGDGPGPVMRWAAAYLATWALLSAGIAWAVEIPADAWQWRRTLTREGQAAWGLNAPISDFGGADSPGERVEAECALAGWARTGWRNSCRPTATWIAGAYPELGPEPQPANPVWAIRALVTYDRHIWDRVTAADDCNRMAKTLCGFNGGPGAYPADERLAASKGLDPTLLVGPRRDCQQRPVRGELAGESAIPCADSDPPRACVRAQ